MPMDQVLPSIAVLMCHAPIVIPAIGRSEAGRCAASTAAMREAARRVVASGVETVALLSPHTPRLRHAYGVVAGEQIRGDFHAFGLPGPELVFPADAALGATCRRRAQDEGLELEPLAVGSLDHGACVPLWFLAEAGFRGRVAVFGFPWEVDGEFNRAFGRALARAHAGLGRSWALVASGDMSHALQPGAPAGFHPRAAAFDEAVCACVEQGDYAGLSALAPEWRALAAEDAVASLEVADGVLAGAGSGRERLSYEAPFGVGYLVAVLHEAP